MTPSRQGTLYGASAYLLWGLFPIYWPLLEPSTALEVLAHRVLWSLVVVVVLLGITRRLAYVRAAVKDRRRLAQTRYPSFPWIARYAGTARRPSGQATDSPGENY